MIEKNQPAVKKQVQNHILYRKLKPSESALYREMRLESLRNFPECFGSSFEEERRIKKLAFEKSIEKEDRNKLMMGAFDRRQLIGICGIIREKQKKCIHRAVIVQMYVRPFYQGQKIGLSLLQAAIHNAFNLHDIEQLTLGVVSDNIGANKIYEKAGFKEYGLLKNYFKYMGKYADERLMVLYKQNN